MRARPPAASYILPMLWCLLSLAVAAEPVPCPGAQLCNGVCIALVEQCTPAPVPPDEFCSARSPPKAPAAPTEVVTDPLCDPTTGVGCAAPPVPAPVTPPCDTPPPKPSPVPPSKP